MIKKFGKATLATIFFTVMFFVTVISLYEPATAEPLETIVSPWKVIDTSTAADDEATALAVGERTYLTVKAAIAAATDSSTGDGEISIFPITSSTLSKANAVRIRAICTDGSACTWDILTGSLAKGTDCDLTLRGTLAFTGGKQVSTYGGTACLADTLTVTEVSSTATITSDSPADDTCAEATIDLQGDDIIVAVPTALASDAKLIAKFY